MENRVEQSKAGGRDSHQEALPLPSREDLTRNWVAAMGWKDVDGVNDLKEVKQTKLVQSRWEMG